MGGTGEVTRLLDAWRNGDSGAFDRLVPIVYDDLKRVARVQARRLRSGETLNTTGLVHETYLRLAAQEKAFGDNRGHFLAVCARAMRQILIDDARRRASVKRGGDAARATLDPERIAIPDRPDRLLALDAALERLGDLSERMVRVVECRYFTGYSDQETAEALAISPRTVQREWTKARAWLREDLGPGHGEAVARDGGA